MFYVCLSEAGTRCYFDVVFKQSLVEFMRLTSHFWLTAIMREIRIEGGFVYLLRRGAEEAGAIFIRQVNSDNSITLYGPAPQICYDEEVSRGDRLFMKLETASEEAIDQKLQQELEFDPDIWVVEIENFTNLHQLSQFGLVLEQEIKI